MKLPKSLINRIVSQILPYLLEQDYTIQIEDGTIRIMFDCADCGHCFEPGTCPECSEETD